MLACNNGGWCLIFDIQAQLAARVWSSFVKIADQYSWAASYGRSLLGVQFLCIESESHAFQSVQ